MRLSTKINVLSELIVRRCASGLVVLMSLFGAIHTQTQNFAYELNLGATAVFLIVSLVYMILYVDVQRRIDHYANSILTDADFEFSDITSVSVFAVLTRYQRAKRRFFEHGLIYESKD